MSECVLQTLACRGLRKAKIHVFTWILGRRQVPSELRKKMNDFRRDMLLGGVCLGRTIL